MQLQLLILILLIIIKEINLNKVIQMTTRKVKVLIVFKIKEIIKMKKSQRHFFKQMKKN